MKGDDLTSTVLFQLLTARRRDREALYEQRHFARREHTGLSDLLLAMMFFALAGVAGLTLVVIIMDLL